LKRLNEGRNELGPPVLSKIPYIDRLFRNVGYGRSGTSILLMVTPRIIIQEATSSGGADAFALQCDFNSSPPTSGVYHTTDGIAWT